MPFDPSGFTPTDQTSTAATARTGSGGGGFDPSGFKETPDKPDTHTTVGGVLGAVERGIAPVLTGAAAGGVLGGPAGAATGAAVVGGAEMASGIYNLIAPHFGLPESITPQEATDKLLDMIGVKRPSTGIERTVETTAGGAASAGSMAAGAGRLAASAANPVVRNVASRLAEGPGRQIVSGAMSGAASQGAAEAGAGPFTQWLAGLGAGGLPYVGGFARPRIPPQQAAQDATAAGYVLPPSSASTAPSFTSRTLEGAGGQLKTRQQAAVGNQPVTNKLAAEALGLPGDTVMSQKVLDQVRSNASAAYKRVAQSVPQINIDANPHLGQWYDRMVNNLAGHNSPAAQIYPNTMTIPGMQELISDMKNARITTPDAVLEFVKKQRANASANLGAKYDPSKVALGLAQRQAADVMDFMLDFYVQNAGFPGLVKDYQQARRLLAMTYDVGAALNPATGNVSAGRLAQLSSRGRPLTGKLATIANAASAFPHAMQNPERFGGSVPAYSALDFMEAAGLAAVGHPVGAGVPLLRPIARHFALSPRYQRAMMSTTPRDRFQPLPLLAGPSATIDPLSPPESYATDQMQ